MARIPESIGKYKVESLIAQGGMGAVYKALHPTLDRPVIIKKLTLRGRKDITERFKREARILMDFRHDGLVDMYDHFKLGSYYYIVLEYIDGLALDVVLKKQRYLDNGTAAYILYKAADALQYAHEKKVVHRDIKPGNIILSKTGAVKLVDFGIAASDEDSEEGLTREGMSLGTPGYMAPEQFQNTKHVDTRADIYALGVLAYEMLTGKKPFPGSFTPELVLTIQKGKYTTPRKFNPHIPGTLLKFIQTAMKPDPQKRYKSLLPILRLLEHFLEKWDHEELKRTVADLAAGKDPVKPERRKKKNILFKLLSVSFIAVLMMSTGLFCYFTGYQNRILHPGSYKAVVFSVRIPKGAQPWNKLFIKADLFRDDDKKIPEVQNTKVFFRKIHEDPTGTSYLFRSIPVYLPQGAYRAKIEIEDTLSWYSFLIKTEAQNKQRTSLFIGTEVRIDQQINSPVHIPVRIKVSDSITGRQIEEGIAVSLSKKGRWVLFPENGSLAGMGIYKFRIGREGYVPKIFTLKIGPGQKTLQINAGLVPLQKAED